MRGKKTLVAFSLVFFIACTDAYYDNEVENRFECSYGETESCVCPTGVIGERKCDETDHWLNCSCDVSIPINADGDASGESDIHDFSDIIIGIDSINDTDSDSEEEETDTNGEGAWVVCDETHPNWTIGLQYCDPRAFQGYTLLYPWFSKTVYLIDMFGREVHRWQTDLAYKGNNVLLENGNLVRPYAGGTKIFDWDGNVVWDFVYDFEPKPHHDIEVLPNGNIVYLANERIDRETAIAAGRDPALLSTSWMEMVVLIEIKPTSPEKGEIVWEWHLVDHLVQDFDDTKDNWGDVAGHPELMDFNYEDQNIPDMMELDWMHANAVAYNAESDQLMISSRHFSEFWIIDHGTTTEQAASHEGGKSGHGGDILYRWGNPMTFRRGGIENRRLWGPHDPHWIQRGLPGEGNILVFNNGFFREGFYSTVDEIVPPVLPTDTCEVVDGVVEPETAAWSYEADPPSDFFSSYISGASRLQNGNTLICEGDNGRIFEVTDNGEIVWEYIVPISLKGPLPQGLIPPEAFNRVFRAARFAPDFPAFMGRDLTPGAYVELPGVVE